MTKLDGVEFGNKLSNAVRMLTAQERGVAASVMLCAASHTGMDKEETRILLDRAGALHHADNTILKAFLHDVAKELGIPDATSWDAERRARYWVRECTYLFAQMYPKD